ncbi:hypothetical protein R1sor_019294 [Riccia sorocarpa]|uniref:HhH-GPD domain-containing protein n=1 Tax=Riccia sorocarpa TaxID=122646 RepID=A0ABD3IEU5_9MARC
MVSSGSCHYLAQRDREETSGRGGERGEGLGHERERRGETEVYGCCASDMHSESTRFRQGVNSYMQVQTTKENKSRGIADRVSQVHQNARGKRFLYGRPVSRLAWVRKEYALRPRIRREDSGLGVALKWGAKKMRVTSREKIVESLLDQQQGLPLVELPDCEPSPCLPEMISNETRPIVAHMDKWPPLHSPVLGPETPVPAQKRFKRRKSGNHVFNNSSGLDPRFKDQSVIDTQCAGNHRMVPVEGGKLVVQLTLYRDPPETPQTPVCCSREQEISTSLPKFQSSISSSESRVQPAAKSSKCRPDDHRVESPGAKGGRTKGSEDYCDTILDISGLVNAVEDFGILGEDEEVYGRQVIGQGNQRIRQLEGSSPGTAGSAEDSNPHTPFGLKFSITKKPRSGQKRRCYPELEQNDWTSPEEISDAAVLNDPEYVVGGKSRSRNARKKLSFDLNKSADKDDLDNDDLDKDDSEFLLEEEKSPEPSQKKKVKKHSRPRVLKDVTKPVRVPKPKKATTPRKAGSTRPRNGKAETTKRSARPRRTKKAQSQATEEDVAPGYNGDGDEGLRVRMDFEILQSENTVEVSSPRLRMRAAARSKERSFLNESNLQLVGSLSRALVPVSNSVRTIVPYMRSRLKRLKPKVQLEDADLQWWKLVMAHGPTYQDEGDEATAGKWGKERVKFKQRAEVFITLMQEVQGNRRFSQWKGSVIDSVVGAFLTQNVSDHLSSSAFMLLAAKYPVSRRSFTEVRVEETFDLEERFPIPLRTGFPEYEYVVEEPTATLEEPELGSVMEELEETREFWNSKCPMQVDTGTQHQSDTETRDGSGTGSGDFRIVDDVECMDPLCNQLPALTTVRDPDAHPVQSTGDTDMRGVHVITSSSCRQVREAVDRDHLLGSRLPQDSDCLTFWANHDTSSRSCCMRVELEEDNSSGCLQLENERKDSLVRDIVEHTEVACKVHIAPPVHSTGNTGTSVDYIEEERSVHCESRDESEEGNPKGFCVSQEVQQLKDPRVHDLHEEATVQTSLPVHTSGDTDRSVGDGGMGDVESTGSGTSKLRDGVEEDKLSGVPPTQDGEDKCCVGHDVTTGDHSAQPAHVTGGTEGSVGDTGTKDVQDTSSSDDYKVWEGLEVDGLSEYSLPQEVEPKDSSVHDVSEETASSLAHPVHRTDNVGMDVGNTGLSHLQGTSSEHSKLQEGLDVDISLKLWTGTMVHETESPKPLSGMNDGQGTSSSDCRVPEVLEANNHSGSSLSQSLGCLTESSNVSNPSVQDVFARSKVGDGLEYTMSSRSSHDCEESLVTDVPSETTVTTISADRVGSTTGVHGSTLRDLTPLDDGNCSGLFPQKEITCKDSLIHCALDEGTGLPLVTDQVQSAVNTEVSAVGGTDSEELKLANVVEDCNHSGSSPPKIGGFKDSVEIGNQTPEKKVSYNNLTGPERALLEQNRTKSKDNTDWEEVRKTSHANGASWRVPEDAINWEAVKAANVEEIAAVIKERGMNNMLAGRIKAFLKRVSEEHTDLNLEWLRDIPPEEAKKFLLSIHGLGLKSVECVRLLTLRHLAFPVDTNVGRICVRLGWVPIEPLPEVKLLSELETYPVQENIQKYLWPRLCTLDQDTLYELHYQMITFGKVFCTKRDPNCGSCPLRNDCKHYTDSILSRPQPPEITFPARSEPSTSHQERLALPAAEANSSLSIAEPVIEEPPSPQREELSERTIHEGRILPWQTPSNALVVLPPGAAKRTVPQLKTVGRLRTVHYVYELPDDHPLLDHTGARVEDDPCPILLALWGPGESPGTDVDSTNGTGDEPAEDTVKGTLLVPCRTANRGAFPLNGTYFQVNEVFADHETSINPITVQRTLLWNLPRRLVYFGTSVTSIFKGLSVNQIQDAFQNGYICVRGFDSKTRAPKPLQPRLHSAASLVQKKRQKQQEKAKTVVENASVAADTERSENDRLEITV